MSEFIESEQARRTMIARHMEISRNSTKIIRNPNLVFFVVFLNIDLPKNYTLSFEFTYDLSKVYALLLEVLGLKNNTGSNTTNS